MQQQVEMETNHYPSAGVAGVDLMLLTMLLVTHLLFGGAKVLWYMSTLAKFRFSQQSI
jgi:hypothetical protein